MKPSTGMNDRWVEALSRLVQERLGYTIPPHRMVREIAPFAVAEAELRGWGDPTGVVEALRNGCAPELWRALVALVTIGETYFFRHPDQIEAMAGIAGRRHRAHGRPLRIWSAGCATGEEAWTIAMRLDRDEIPCRVTASDVNREALARLAGRGPYSDRSAGHLASDYRDRWLREEEGGGWRVEEGERLRVEILHHNLVEDAPLHAPDGGWDLILCRNVLLYFDPETGRRVLEKLGRTLGPGGTLWIAPCDHASPAKTGLTWNLVGSRRHLANASDDARPQAVPETPIDAISSPTWSEEVETCLEQGRVDEARAAVERRLRAVPGAGRAGVARAAFHLREHAFEAALEDLARAERARPRPEGLAYLQGIAHLKAGRRDEALRAFLQAVEDDPDDWASSWHAADLYRSAGRTLHEELMLRRTRELLDAVDPEPLALGPAARLINSVHLDPEGVRSAVTARLESKGKR